ncbi:MAG: hypothetical protein R2764_00960 [Bacteroidales bacterium]
MRLAIRKIAISVFLYCPIFLFGQIPQTAIDTAALREELKIYEHKEVTVIGDNLGNTEDKACVQKAIRITTDGVILDTCYHFKAREFTEDMRKDLLADQFYLELLRIDNDRLVGLQTELNKKVGKNCEESSKPYIIIVKDRENESTYGLRRLLDCLPAKSESFMKNLDACINSIP